MELHNPVVAGEALLHSEHGKYVSPLAFVPRKFVESRTAGVALIKDISPTDPNNIVGFKTYLDNTVPTKFAMDAATANTNEVDVTIYARPRGYSMNDKFKVNGTDVVMTAVNGDPSMLEGVISLVLDAGVPDQVITVTGDDGIQHDVALTLLIGGPVVTQATFVLPEGQTHVKAGDTVTVSGVIDNTAVEAAVLASGIVVELTVLILGAEDSAATGYRVFEGSFVVSAVAADSPYKVAGANALGTVGEIFTSLDVPVDQTYPSISGAAYVYPTGQFAVKDGESVDVTVDVTNQDSVTYVLAAGMSVLDDTVYENIKTVLVSAGNAAFSFDNKDYSITAVRNANGAETTRAFTIDVANVAPEVSAEWKNSPKYLRTPASYTLLLTSDQPLSAAPLALDAQAGIFVGEFLRKSDTLYAIEFKVTDLDARGTHTFLDFSLFGRSGIEQTVIGSGNSFVIRGLYSRDIVVGAMLQIAEIGSAVFDKAKVIATYKDADTLTYRPSKAQFSKGYTLVDSLGNLDTNGTHIWLTDAVFAGANTSGTLTLTFEEV